MAIKNTRTFCEKFLEWFLFAVGAVVGIAAIVAPWIVCPKVMATNRNAGTVFLAIVVGVFVCVGLLLVAMELFIVSDNYCAVKSDELIDPDSVPLKVIPINDVRQSRDSQNE